LSARAFSGINPLSIVGAQNAALRGNLFGFDPRAYELH
jgi:hypothetical protein